LLFYLFLSNSVSAICRLAFEMGVQRGHPEPNPNSNPETGQRQRQRKRQNQLRWAQNFLQFRVQGNCTSTLRHRRTVTANWVSIIKYDIGKRISGSLSISLVCVLCVCAVCGLPALTIEMKCWCSMWIQDSRSLRRQMFVSYAYHVRMLEDAPHNERVAIASLYIHHILINASLPTSASFQLMHPSRACLSLIQLYVNPYSIYHITSYTI